ncbi:MAG: hypothetical protein C4542_08520 [Dehalococcoidia bacterium]|nr:MAG: hypothetical protein C4542_08520 [Dehalococcoidia bacterium]
MTRISAIISAIPSYRRPILITLAVLGLWIIDAWLVGAFTAVLAAARAWIAAGISSSPDYSTAARYLSHPLQTAFTAAPIMNPATRQMFLLSHAVTIPALIIAHLFRSRSSPLINHGNRLKISRDDASCGTAGWMPLSEAKAVLAAGHGPGTFFGLADAWPNPPLRLPPGKGFNRNVVVFGTTGSMKSRSYVRNNILNAVLSNESVVVTDPKGELYRDCAAMLEKNGYTVKTLNLVSMLNSDRWNPLNEVSTDQDAQVFSEVVVANTGMPGMKKIGGDPFWDRAEQNLLKALSLYVVSEYAPERRNLGSLYAILAAGDDRQVDMLFTALPDDHPAKDPYNIYRLSGDKVKGSVVLGLGTRLQIFQNKAVQDLTAESDIDMSGPGKTKCAYFCVFPDTHSTFDFLVSLFFSFLFIRLIDLADRNNGPCPVNVHFLLDEFAVRPYAA